MTILKTGSKLAGITLPVAIKLSLSLSSFVISSSIIFPSFAPNLSQ